MNAGLLAMLVQNLKVSLAEGDVEASLLRSKRSQQQKWGKGHENTQTNCSHGIDGIGDSSQHGPATCFRRPVGHRTV